MIHVTFRKEGFKTFSANFPPCARSNAHITHESYSHWRIMLPRRLLAFLVIGGVLAVSAAYFRAGGPRISDSPSKKARMTSLSEPPDPKHGPASMVVAMGGAAGIAVPLFAFLGKLLDHGTLVADDPVLSNRLLIAVVVVFSPACSPMPSPMLSKLWHRRCCRRRRCYRRRRPWRQKSRTGRKARRRPARRARRRIRRRTSRC